MLTPTIQERPLVMGILNVTPIPFLMVGNGTKEIGQS